MFHLTRKDHWLSLLILVLFAAMVFSALPQNSSAADTPEQLASKFAPILRFTSGEKFYPASVDYIIESSSLKRRNSDGSSTSISSNPTKYDLGSYVGSDLFLDNNQNTLEEIASDYTANVNTIGYHAYIHIVTSGSSKVIQYWLFYVFNNGPLNDHEGDIEVVQIFLDNSGNPQRALYSQHSSGQNALWTDVEKSDTHPIVYVAQGSHANYFRSYQGKIGIENDIVGGDGLTIKPENLNLTVLGEANSHPPDQSWLDFAGRWGFVGNDTDLVLGRAGPLGPVYNQDGKRWANPQAYINSTFSVDGNYFILAWIVANMLLIFIIYTLIRAAWKIWGIIKLRKKGGLIVSRFLKGRNGVALVLVIVAILITIVAFILPWYTITASSEMGPLAQQGGVELMNVDGINGMKINLFLGSNGDSTSGYRTLFFMQIPFALFFAVGLILLALDLIGVKSGKSLSLKLVLGAIASLLPFILILVFITQLPAFLPWASNLVPDQDIPLTVKQMIDTVAGNPVYGTISQSVPVAGMTSVTWGFGLGAYLFIIAAALRIVAALIMRKSSSSVETETATPPPPPPPTL